MGLVRSWLGQALRATGAAVVVPVAILAALSLSAVGGGSGLGGLGALSQIVSGPRAAGSGAPVDDGESEIADAVTQLAAADGGAPAGAAPFDSGGGPPGPAPEDGGGPVAPLPDGPDDDGGPPGGTNLPTPPPDGGGEGGGGSPPPPERPGLVEGIGEDVEDVAGGTPLAPTIEDAVDTLVELCGRLGCP